jgi:putative restriction endonuclease
MRADAEEMLRARAITHVQALKARYGVLHWAQIAEGFEVDGRRIHLANKARGIHRPKEMKVGALSIKTTVPREGRERRYDDGIASDDPWFVYRWQGTEAGNRDNVDLRDCLRLRLPLIYFYGVAEARYLPMIGHVVHEDAGERCFHFTPLEAGVVTGDEVVRIAATPPLEIERRYAVREMKQRLHQSRFREAVLDAYETKCAICRLRHRPLLEAAHIVPDAEKLGEARVPNGISLCKLHHAAFDALLLGITPDCEVRLRDALLVEKDGPMLEHGLRDFHGQRLVLPERPEERPDRDLLALRWERFVGAP